MTRLMYDSTNINDIPQSAPIVGFYTDGIYAASLVGVRARFPNALLVGISAIGTNSGVVGDCELGDMTTAGVIQWVKMRRAAGIDPTVYCNETNSWPGLRQAFQNAGVAAPHWWCANYDGVAVLRAGQVARQYANPTLTKHHYDLSVVADFWPGVDGLHSGSSGSLEDDMTPEEHGWLKAVAAALQADTGSNVDAIAKAIPADLTARLQRIEVAIGVPATSWDSTDVLAAIAKVQTIVDKIDRGE